MRSLRKKKNKEKLKEKEKDDVYKKAIMKRKKMQNYNEIR